MRILGNNNSYLTYIKRTPLSLFERGFFISPPILRSCPSLGFVEHGEVATNLQLVAIEPNRTLVGFAVLGIVDAATFPLLLVLGKTSEDICAYKFAALQFLVRILAVELFVASLELDNLAVQLITTLINLHLGITTFGYPLANNVLGMHA